MISAAKKKERDMPGVEAGQVQVPPWDSTCHYNTSLLLLLLLLLLRDAWLINLTVHPRLEAAFYRRSLRQSFVVVTRQADHIPSHYLSHRIGRRPARHSAANTETSQYWSSATLDFNSGRYPSRPNYSSSKYSVTTEVH